MKKKIIQIVGWIFILMGLFSSILIDIINPEEVNLIILFLLFTTNLVFNLSLMLVGAIFIISPNTVIEFIIKKNKKKILISKN